MRGFILIDSETRMVWREELRESVNAGTHTSYANNNYNKYKAKAYFLRVYLVTLLGTIRHPGATCTARSATSVLTQLLQSYWGYDQPHADLLFEVMSCGPTIRGNVYYSYC